MEIPAYYRNYPTLTPELVNGFEEIKAKMILADNRKTLPASFPKLTAFEAIKSATDQAVRLVEETVAALKEDAAYTREYLSTLLACKYEMAYARMQLRVNLETVLSGPYPLVSPSTIYKYDSSDEAQAESMPRNPLLKGTTILYRGLLENNLLMPYDNAAEFYEYYADLHDLFIKTLIHEAIHRNLANQLNEFFWDEVYEHDKPEAFAKLTCLQHLENADSYGVLATRLPKVLNRYNPRVESGPIGLTLEIDISQRDTLWGIADRVLLDGTKWPLIWEQNKDHLRSKSPNLIYPGEHLSINLPDQR